MNSPLLAVLPQDVVDTGPKSKKAFGIAEPSFESCSSESYGFSSDNEYQSDRSRMKKKRSICQAMTSTLKIAMNQECSSSGDESSATTIPFSLRRRHLRFASKPRPAKKEANMLFPSVGSPLHSIHHSPSPPSTDSDSEGMSSDEDGRRKRVSYESYNALKEEKLKNRIDTLSAPSGALSSGSSSSQRLRSPIRNSSPEKGERKRRRSTSFSDEGVRQKKKLKRDTSSKRTATITAMPVQRESMRMALHRCKLQKRKFLPDSYGSSPTSPSTSQFQPSLIL